MRQAGLLLVLIMLVGGLLLPVNPSQFPANQLAANQPSSAEQRVQASFFSLPLSFEPNRGQIDEQADFIARGPGYTLFLTPTEAVLVLPGGTENEKRTPEAHPPRAEKTKSVAEGNGQPTTRNSLVGTGFSPYDAQQQNTGASAPEGKSVEIATLRMQLVGANPAPEIEGRDPLPGKSNYFIGNDPAKWRTNVPHYGKVAYREVYPGIDLAYYGTNQRQLEYDFIVAPGADPANIRLRFEGAKQIHIDESGNLLLDYPGGQIVQHAPVIYQETDGERTPVEGGYLLSEDAQVSFQVSDYDSDLPLIIDPVLGYSSYLGGSGSEVGFAIAVDATGSVYMTGFTNSTDFPTTSGALDTNLGSDIDCPDFHGCGSSDVFVAKLNPSGSAIEYSTYLGGVSSDRATAIVVDAMGDVYVTGQTSSTDYPTTPESFQPACHLEFGTSGSCTDIFVTKLNSTGSALVYSTFLGGQSNDRAFDIAVDGVGNAYVTGNTTSADFPSTLDAFNFPSGLGGAVLVSKLNEDGSGLVYSATFGRATGHAIAVDSSGNAYVTGITGPDFPIVNAFQPNNGGGGDAFVTKLNPTGSNAIYSTFLGGSNGDMGSDIAVDDAGNVYVAGSTTSPDFPTANPFQQFFGGPTVFPGDGFVSKLVADGSALVYSTYFGGSDVDDAQGIALDAAGNAYLTGSTKSNDFPIANALQPSKSGNVDAFVAKFSISGSFVVYSTYLGGAAQDNGDPSLGGLRAGRIAVDATGNVYLSGFTESNDFPTAHALQPTLAGPRDAFVAKICGATPDPGNLSFSDQVVETTSAERTITLTNLGSVALTITSIVASSDYDQTNTCSNPLAIGGSCPISVTFTPTAAGTRTGDVTITDDACGNPYTVPLTGTGLNPVPAISSLSPVRTETGGTNFTLTVTGSGFVADSVVRWDGSDRTTTFVGSGELQAIILTTDIASPGTAEVTVFNPEPGGGVSNSQTFFFTDFNLSTSPSSATVSAGQAATYTVTVVPVGGPFDPTVSLSCSGLPSLSSCSFSPPSVTPGANPATSTLTITTTAPSATYPSLPGTWPAAPLPVLWPGLALLALLVPMLWSAKGRKKQRLAWLPVGAVLCLLLLLAGCGSGASTPPIPNPGTPLGSRTITVTGTAGSLTHNTTVTLVVQ